MLALLLSCSSGYYPPSNIKNISEMIINNPESIDSIFRIAEIKYPHKTEYPDKELKLIKTCFSRSYIYEPYYSYSIEYNDSTDLVVLSYTSSSESCKNLVLETTFVIEKSGTYFFRGVTTHYPGVYDVLDTIYLRKK
jgi:hypothetical protein